MAKTGNKKDNRLFGGFFDLNGNGKTDALEAALMFTLFDETPNENEKKRPEKASLCGTDKATDLDDLDIDGM